MNNNIPKFNIEANQKVPLKLFVLSVQDGRVIINVPQDLRLILSYSREDAIKTAKKDYPADKLLRITEKGSMEVSNLLKVLNLPQEQAIPLKQEEIFITPQMKKQEFVNGLMLVTDQFVESDEDKETIKKILKNVQLEKKRT